MVNARRTRLEAVNWMLAGIGELPISSIEDSAGLPADALLAITTLDETSRQVQEEGWHFNTEKNVTLTPNGDSIIQVPENVIAVDAALGDHTGFDLVLRGNRLYDLCTQSFTFTKDMKVTQTVLLEFSDLPGPFQAWIQRVAAVEFQQQVLGSTQLDQRLVRSAAVAEERARGGEMEQADYNVLRSPAVARVFVGRVSPLNRMVRR